VATYLVTGGCGFIGSHLADALIAQGHAVRILDDLSCGRLENRPAAAELVRGDVADPGLVARAMAGVDGCFHLAAIASVERGHRDWLGCHRANLTGAITVFDAARRARAAGPVPVVYASSAAVYGDNDALPLGEDAAPRPLSAYGADKLGCELHARIAGTVHGVPTAGLRFFNVYGPRQDPRSPYSGVISIFCDRLRAGQDVTLFGDGGQTRDFVYVGDVVTALTAVMARLARAAEAEAAAPAELYNVCTGRATTIGALARLIARLCRVELRIGRAAPRAGDIRASLGDPRRLAEALGVRPATPLATGLARTLVAAPPSVPQRRRVG
jgi:UDP-glucose 4-epimerase